MAGMMERCARLPVNGRRLEACAMSTRRLPPDFEDLEPYVDWALPGEISRGRKRASSPMREIQSFYDAMLPRMDAVMGYLNAHPLDELSAEAQRLMNMVMSLAEIGPAVEFYGEPAVIDGFPMERFVPVAVH